MKLFFEKTAENYGFWGTIFFGEKGASNAKTKYNLFYHKSGAKYFFTSQFFWKRHIFREKTENRFWRPWPIFRLRGVWIQKWMQHVLSLMSSWIFYNKAFSTEKAISSEKTAKNHFWGTQSFSRGRGLPTTKVNILFFITNDVLNILLLSYFLKKNPVFSEKTTKNCNRGGGKEASYAKTKLLSLIITN